jgi:Fic family protein
MKAHHHHTESRIMQNEQFTTASRTFHGAITEYLEDAGYPPIDWALWLDIRGMAKSGNTSGAAQTLRDASSVYRTTTTPLPISTTTVSSFVNFCRWKATRKVLDYRLGVLQSNQIIELLVAAEDFFD